MRALAATMLIVLGLIGTVCLGFVALFTASAVFSDADAASSRFGALLVTCTPLLCVAAAVCGIVVTKRLGSSGTAKPNDEKALLVRGIILLGLAALFITVGGPMIRLS